MKRNAGFFFSITVIFLFLSLCRADLQVGQNRGPAVVKPETEKLEIEKLEQEIEKLYLENGNSRSRWTKLSSNTSFIIAIVAIISSFATAWKYFAEFRRQNRRHIDEKITSILRDLGSEDRSMQIGAVASIMTFLGPEYRCYHDQIFGILLTQVKKNPGRESGNYLLVKAFEKTLRERLERSKRKGKTILRVFRTPLTCVKNVFRKNENYLLTKNLREKNRRKPGDTEKNIPLDLSGAYLDQADLSGLDLTGVILEKARLIDANLTKTILFKSQGRKVNFEGAVLNDADLGQANFPEANFMNAKLLNCILVSANLKEKANFCGADLSYAHLQEAHFENAQFSGKTKFDKADVNNTFFRGVAFDPQTIMKLSMSCNWEKANYTGEEIKNRIAEAKATRQHKPLAGETSTPPQ